MQFETNDDLSAQDGSIRPPAEATTPYEAERQARADVAGVCAQREHSNQRGVMREANPSYLREACDRTSVTLAFDTRILAWLAGWEAETCAVVAGLVIRAHAAGLSVADSTGPLSEQNGRYQRRPR